MFLVDRTVKWPTKKSQQPELSPADVEVVAKGLGSVFERIDSIQQGLVRGTILDDAQRVREAGQLVRAESPVRGRHPLNLAAAQMAIMKVSEARPDNLADRLSGLAESSIDFGPSEIVQRVLTEDEQQYFEAAQTIVGLIAMASDRKRQ